MKRIFNSIISKKQKQPTLFFNTIDISEAITNAEANDNMLKIVPIGSFPNHHQGAIVITKKEIDEMVKNGKKSGTDILVDYGHDSNWDPSAIAAGWSPKQKLEARNDGLYIEFPTFTEAAQGKIDQKEYRYLSPVFYLCSRDKKGKEVGAKLISIGLVNRPYFDKEIDHIGNTAIKNIIQNNNQNEEENKMLSKIICNFFGLEEGASVEDLEAVINTDELKGKTFAEVRSQKPEGNDNDEPTDDDPEGNDNDEPTANSEIDNLKKDVDDLKKANETRQNEKAEALVNQAIDAGKILPADKQVWLNSALKDYDDTKAKLDAKKSSMPPKLPISEGVDLSSNQAVANAARELVAKEAKAGNRISFTQAVNRIKGQK